MPDDLAEEIAERRRQREQQTLGGLPIVAQPERDPLAENIASRRKVALASAVLVGSKANPDTRAKALALAKQTRLPVDVVERNLDDVRRKVQASPADLEAIRQNQPELAEWLSDHNNAAVSNDDLPIMRRIDAATRQLRGEDPSGILPKGFQFSGGAIIEPLGDGSLANRYATIQDLQKELLRRGETDAILDMERQQRASELSAQFGPAANLVAGAAGSIEATQRALGTRTIYDHDAEQIQEASRTLSPGFWGDVQRGAGGVIADLPLMMSGGAFTEGLVALSRLSKSRAAVDAFLATRKGDMAKAALASQPLAIREGLNTADENGIANGAASWLIETAIPGAFGRTGVERYLTPGATDAVADGWRGFASRMLKDAGLEGGEEMVTEWAHAVHEAATGINPNALDPDALWRRLSVAGAVGAVAGAGFSLPANLAEKFSRDGEEARRATVHADRLTDLTKILTESKTNARAESAVADEMNKVLGQSDRFQYVDAQDFRDAYEDPAQAAAEMGLTKDYAEALATGGQLKIPTTTLVQRAAKDEATAKLIEKVRRAPDARNAIEAAEFTDKAPDEVKRLANEAKAAAATAKLAADDPVAAVEADIQAKLEKAGHDPVRAKTNAKLMAAQFATFAKRSGKDAGDLYRQYLDGNIKKVLPKLLRGEKFDLVDSMLARIRKGEVPSDRDIAGPSLVDFLRKKGVQDATLNAELVSLMESDRTRKPGEKNLVRDDGQNLDDARAAAIEAGYLPEGASINDLLAAMDDEIRGNSPRFSERGGDPNQAAIRQALDGMVEALEAAGVDPLTATNKQAREALAKHLEEQEGKSLDQGAAITAPKSGRLDFDAILKQWRKATGDRTPIGGDAAFAELARLSDEVDAQQGKSYHQPGRGPRGSLVFNKGKAYAIRLFQGENLSTFAHESAHLSLQILRDLATMEGAAPELVADFQKVKDWFAANAKEIRKQAGELARDKGAAAHVIVNGIENLSDEDVAAIAQKFEDAPADGTAEGWVHEAMHEYFARGWEGYLLEGKAPTPALRRVFNRVKGWMVGLYRLVRTLRVELNPEIRGVFDRLVAIEDEVDAAEDRAGTKDILPPEAFPDLATYDRYRTAVQASQERAEATLQKQLIGDYRKELERARDEQYAQVRAETADEVNARPVYQVISALQRGEMPDGTRLPDEFQGVKLDREELVREWGEDVLKKLPGPGSKANAGAYVYAAENGLPLAQVAASWGFADPSAMIESMIAAPDRDSLIQTMTDARMAAEHPDPLTDGSLPDRVDAAISGENRGDLLALEMRALGQKTGQTPAPIEVLREFARDTIQNQLARDLRPDVYRRAASQASRRATEAAGKKDWSTAYVETQREALNLELWRASRDAKEASEQGRKYLKSFNSLDARQRIGKAGGWEFTVYDAEGAPIASFQSQEEASDFAALEQGRSYKRTNGYLEQIEAVLEGYDLRRVSNRALRKSAQVRKWLEKQRADGNDIDIDPAVYEDLGSRNWNDLTVEDQAEVVAAVHKIAHAAALKNKLLKASRDREIEAAQQAGSESILANKKGNAPKTEQGETPAEAIAAAGKGFTGWHRKDSFLLRAMDGRKDAGIMWELIQRPRNDAATEEETMNLEVSQKVDAAFREWGKSLGWTRQDIPGTKLRLTTEQRVSLALNWGHAEGRRRILRQLEDENMDQRDVQAVIDSLDAKDWKLVNDLVGIINSYWSDVAALEQRMTGLAPEKVKALPIHTKDHGWQPGGYYPLKYDAAKSKRGGDAAVKAALEDNLKTAGARGMTRRSHTKMRVEDVKGLVVDLSLDVAGKHLVEVIHDLTHREMNRDQIALLKDGQPIADAIIKKWGVGALKQLVETAGAIATRDITPSTAASRLVALFRRGNTAATFTFQLTSALMNLTGIASSIARVGPLRLLSAMASVTKNAATLEWAGTWVQNKSDMMRIRGGNNVREVSEALREVGRLSGVQKTIRLGYLPMQKVVQLVDTITWIAAYRQAMDAEFNKGKTEEEADKLAVAVADQTVLDTQGSGRIGDLSAIQRGGELSKLLTMFYGYFNVQANLIGEQIGLAREEGGLQWLKSATTILMIGPVATILTNLIKAALRGDERDEDPKEMARRMALEQLGTAAGMLVLVRELSGGIESGFGYGGPASFSVIGNATKLIQEVKQGDLTGITKGLISTVGSLTGLPSRVANQAVDAFLQFEEGEGALAATRALLFGKPLRDHK